MWKGRGQIQLNAKEEIKAFFLQNEISYGAAKPLLLPVEVIIEIQNRENTAVEVTGAYLDIASSVTDKQPAIQISIGEPKTQCEYYLPRIRFENFGWSNANDAELHYSFTNPIDSSFPTKFTETKKIGEIEKVLVVDFEKELFAKSLKVDLISSNPLMDSCAQLRIHLSVLQVAHLKPNLV
jgi:hypothetical protein